MEAAPQHSHGIAQIIPCYRIAIANPDLALVPYITRDPITVITGSMSLEVKVCMLFVDGRYPRLARSAIAPIKGRDLWTGGIG